MPKSSDDVQIFKNGLTHEYLSKLLDSRFEFIKYRLRMLREKKTCCSNLPRQLFGKQLRRKNVLWNSFPSYLARKITRRLLSTAESRQKWSSRTYWWVSFTGLHEKFMGSHKSVLRRLTECGNRQARTDVHRQIKSTTNLYHSDSLRYWFFFSDCTVRNFTCASVMKSANTYISKRNHSLLKRRDRKATRDANTSSLGNINIFSLTN